MNVQPRDAAFLTVLASAMLALWVAPAAAAQASKENWVVVYAGTLLAVPGKAPEREKTIVIKDGLVQSVLDGYVDPGRTPARDATIISLKDRFVLPGLMDMHVHLSSGQSASMTERNNDADITVTAVANARTTLMAGFTTVRDVGSRGPAMFSVRDGIDRGRIVGPRIYAAGRVISVTAGHGDHLLTTDTDELFCDGPDACRKLVREQIRVGADLIKISVTGGGREDNGGPDDPPEMFDDEIKAVTDTAHSMKRLVAAHAHGTAGINAALRNGVDSIEHGTFPDEESIKLYKKTGAIMVPTLAYITGWNEAYLATLTPDQKIRKQQFITRQPKGVAMAYKAGVTIAAGTDFGGLIPQGENARELVAYVELAGMTPMDAIVTATVNGAKLLRQTEHLGTLEPGKFADLIAVEGSPLDDIHVLMKVPFVMKGGEVVKSN